MRVVLDTNVIISGLFWTGAPRRVLDLAAAGRFKSLTSPELLAELEGVLTEDFGLPQERAEMVVRDIVAHSEIVTPLGDVEADVRDLGDVKVLACALAGNADCIVTGDADLLQLAEIRGIRILTVAELLQGCA